MILAYHSVSDRPHTLAVRPRDFARQVAWLATQPVLSLEEYARRRFIGDRRRAFSLTFDDGYDDFAETAWPLLRQHGLPATVFVPSSLVDGALALDGPPPQERWPVMTGDQLHAVAATGAGIGSHGASHALLPDLDGPRLHEEVTGSKQALETRLGRPVTTFCYPAGRLDRRVIGAVAAAGYAWAVVTPRQPGHVEGRLTLRRVGVYSHDSASRFRLKTSAIGEPAVAAKRVLAALRP